MTFERGPARHGLGERVRARLPHGMVTGGELERQEREAAALHAEAQELRERLAVHVPRGAQASGPSPVIRPLAGIVAALTGLGLLAVLLLRPDDAAPVSRLASAEPEPSATVTAQAPVVAPAQAATPTTTAGSSTPASSGGTTRAARLQSLGLPPTGPGVNSPGTALSVRVTGREIAVTGLIRVVEPGRTLTLTLASTEGLSRASAAPGPEVRDLRVRADGVGIDVERAEGTTVAWKVRSRGGDVREVWVEYRLSGAVAGGATSTGVTDLGLVLPLVADQAAPVTALSTGAQVLGMTCPDAAGWAPICGRATTEGWSVTVPTGERALVLLLAARR